MKKAVSKEKSKKRRSMVKDMKNAMFHSAILIPILFIGYVLTGWYRLSIPEWNFYPGYGITAFILVALTFFWLEVPVSLRESCCNASWYEVEYYAVPVELYCLLFYAEWQYTSFLILCVVLVAAVVTSGFVFRYRENRRAAYVRSKKERRNVRIWYRHYFHQFAITVVFAACIPATVLTLFVYELEAPVIRVEGGEGMEEQSQEGEDTAQVGEEAVLTQNMGSLLVLRLQTKRWDTLSASQRVSVLQALTDYEARRLGIPSLPLSSRRQEINQLGVYDVDGNSIEVNLQYMMEEPLETSIDTTCHEVYHAYQHYLVEAVDWDGAAAKTAYFDELREWKENDDHYLTAEEDGTDAYENQPLEVSARAFAKEETDRIMALVEAYDS